MVKLITLFILIGFLHVSATGLAQQITLSKNNITFKEIKKQSEYNFLWAARNVKSSMKLNVHLQQVPLAEALDQLFNGLPLTYVLEDNTILIKEKEKSLVDRLRYTLTTGDEVDIPSQDRTITGRVTDSLGNPLRGATIRVKPADGGTDALNASQVATLTDRDGRFTLRDVPAEASLQISYLGYRSKEVKANVDLGTIVLSTDLTALEEAEVTVSTGYQEIPKERATGSFVYLDNELVNRRVSTNIIDRLEGVVPGLVFNRNTAGSINGTDISIRGHSTIFANNQPLIVLDNFPYDGDISNINPNQIQSITVLKDAAAASIWGAKSGNGVIVITTKKSSRNSPMDIDLNANVTVGDKPDLFYSPNFLDAGNFIDMEKRLYEQGYYNSDLTSPSYPVVSPVVEILASDQSQNQKDQQIETLRNVDVRDQLLKYLYQSSVNQQYNLNIKGGNTNSDYFVSAGYDHNLSNQVGNKNRRLTLNSIYNLNPVKWMELSFGLNYVQSSGNSNSPLGNLNPGSKELYPYSQIADVAGNPLPIVKNYAGSYTDAAIENGLLDWKYRPLDELYANNNTSGLIDNRINAGAKFKILPGLNIDFKYQYEKSRSENESYSSTDSYSARNLINRFTQNNEGVMSYPVPIGGILYQRSLNISSHRVRAQGNYNKVWQDHEVTAIAGGEISDVTTATNANTVYGYDQNTGAFQQVNLVDYFSTNPAGSNLIPSSLGFQSLSDRYISYFGNGSYFYQAKYGISVSGRIDKSNLFGVKTNQKSVPLYSIGVSWELSKENFYHADWLPYARFRITYGHNGNVDKSLTAVTTMRQLNSTDFRVTQGPYAQIANPGNPELRWEKIAILNFGLDFSLKKRILSGSVEYFHKKGIELIGDAPLPMSTGFNTFRGNVAGTKGSGIDLTLNSVNISGGTLRWETVGIFSYITEKVSQYDAEQTVSNTLTFGTGNNGVILPLLDKPLFGVYSYKWAGLDPQNGDPRGYLNGQVSTDYAAILAETPLDSLEYSGTSRPKVFGSLRNTFTYKHFSLSANIIYKLDYYFRRSSISYSALYQSWSGHNDYVKRWQSVGDELTTDVPSEAALPINGGREGFYASSAALVSKGDHIRLQDITLSYDFNNRWLNRTPFRSLRFYCYVNNVGILWRANKHNLDPDLFSSAYFPQPRTVSFGIKTQF